MSDAVSTSDAGSAASAASEAVSASEAVPASEAVSASDIDRFSYDVVVVGAGGSGLRAAIEARLHGKKTAIISKSLFGKAHTVMAEGGCAAAMGNVNPNDNWQVHFRDTMRGGKFLNNWRMAELHAKEAPERVWELEAWGAVFDRTKDGKISQRNFGGHEYPRLAHVGDRTGLEMIRSLQQKVVAMQQQDAVEFGDPEAMIKVFAETTITELIKADGRIAGSLRVLQGHRPVRAVRGARGGAGHRRHRQDLQGHLELVGVHRRRSRAGAARRGQAAEHGVRPAAPDRDDLAALGARAAGHRVGARRWRRAAQLRGQTVHVQLRARRVPGAVRGDRGRGGPLVRRPGPQPAPARAAPPRRGGPLDQLRGQGGPRVAARRDLPGYRVPAARRIHLAAAAVHVSPVQGTGRRGHHQGADGDRPDRPLRDGRGRGGPGDRRRLGAGPVRGRRGVRRHARVQPARRQLAVGPDRVRPQVGARRRRVRLGAARRGRPSPRRPWRRPRRSAPSRWSGPRARTRTPSTASCSRS